MNDFESVLNVHLKAIADRDLSVFSKFLHPSQNIIIILPNGNIIEGFESVVNFHKRWFEDLDWHMDVKMLDIITIDNVGYALLDVIYHDLDEDGNPYELKYFLSLLFNKINNRWFLIRDQNTLK
ncbi:MAG: nuclear transport factor 2 family protein [Defluviitaleaceae bacterium]|nr:nuclear transport factor 2 family protein [Defluviitaleaceae bacterium]